MTNRDDILKTRQNHSAMPLTNRDCWPIGIDPDDLLKLAHPQFASRESVAGRYLQK